MKVATQSLVLFSVLSRLLHPSLGASSALRGGERKTANAATRVETFTIANTRDGETDLWYPKEWKPIKTETKAGYYGCGVVARLSVPEVNLDVDRLVWSIDLKSCLWKNWDLQRTTQLCGGYKGIPYANQDILNTTMCPQNYFIHGGQVRKPIYGLGNGRFNMMYSGLRILCEHPDTKDTKWITVLQGVTRDSQNGEWAPEVVFTRNKYAKGGQVRYLNYDETKTEYELGMIGLRLQTDVLHYNLSLEPIKGYWLPGPYSPNPKVVITNGITMSSGSAATREQSFGLSQSISAGIEF